MCILGEASQFLVPEGTYVRIPISNSQKGCLKICRCSNKGVINECQPLPCISYDTCVLSNKIIQHGIYDFKSLAFETYNLRHY